MGKEVLGLPRWLAPFVARLERRRRSGLTYCWPNLRYHFRIAS